MLFICIWYYRSSLEIWCGGYSSGRVVSSMALSLPCPCLTRQERIFAILALFSVQVLAAAVNNKPEGAGVSYDCALTCGGGDVSYDLIVELGSTYLPGLNRTFISRQFASEQKKDGWILGAIYHS